jgi:lactate 2-monooxygenase
VEAGAAPSYPPPVLDSGPLVQNAIYVAGGPEWPVSPEEWEERAREALEPAAYDYVAGGAGSEATMRANLEAFARVRLRPRMLVGTAERDLSVELPGLRSPVPFLLAPIGVLSIVHPDAELAVARAAAATGVPLVLSSAASTPLEDVAAAGPPRWFQLYWFSDRELAESLVRRAEEAGYGAVVVTVDTLTLGWRDRDLRRGYLPFLGGEGLAQFFSDPVFRAGLAAPPEDDVTTASIQALTTFPNLGLTWADLGWLRERTSLPLLVKGVLRGDDARLALEHGADGVVVSNHGGRQVDGAVAALDALVEVRDAVGPDTTVLMDSGVRRGGDVLKAVALGADAVLLGRPYAYGLAAGGQAGVEAVVRQLAAELDLTCALSGVRTLADADRSLVAP